MMKLFYNLQRGVGLLVFCTILLSACVNHISEEEEDSVNNGDIPLKFIADKPKVGGRLRLLQPAWSLDDEILRNERFLPVAKRLQEPVLSCSQRIDAALKMFCLTLCRG